MEINSELEKAYRTTDYSVFTDPEFVMLIDIHSSELQKLMAERQFSQCAFISACNPYSDPLDESVNLQRHSDLTNELNELGFEFIPGFGLDQQGLFAGEKSVLVLNIPKESARMLGNKYKQNAILWIEDDAIPQLLFLEGQSV